MSWERVGVSIGAVGASSVARPAGVRKGDLVVVSLVADGNSGHAPTISGFVARQSASPAGFEDTGVTVWTRLAGASEAASYAVSGDFLASKSSLVCAAYRGVHPVPVGDAMDPSATVVLPTAPAHALVLGWFSREQGTASVAAPPAGWTEVADVNQSLSGARGHAVAEYQVGAVDVSSLSATVTWTPGGGDVLGVLLAFSALPRQMGRVRGRFLAPRIRGRVVSL